MSMNIPVVKLTMDLGMMGKVIMLMFLFLSLWSWGVVFARVGFLNKILSGNKRFRRRFHDVKRLSEIDRVGNAELNTPMGQVAEAGAAEYGRIMDDAQARTGVRDPSFFLEFQLTLAKERLESVLTGVITPIDRGIYLLAMISSIAPFLGLLGTVWGITDSFYEIGNQGSASLTVVAPGIAAALLTTIAGLIVAIPALFFYNYCSKKAERAANELEEFGETLMVRLRREVFSAFFAAENPQNRQYAAPPAPQGGGYRQ